MSIGILRGLLTLSLFIAFIALWIWAYSKSPRATFEAAARLPLEDDSVVDGRSEST
jgi:cytochrome c oxidase cbb3-type subunit 4